MVTEPAETSPLFLFTDNAIKDSPVAQAIAAWSCFALLGTWHQPDAFVQACQDGRPALALLHVPTFNLAATALIQRLQRADESLPIVVWVEQSKPNDWLIFSYSGASGYGVAGHDDAGLLTLLHHVATQGLALGIHLWSAVRQRFFTNPHLTKRELVVVRLVASGQSNKEIACALGISADTVDTHLRRLQTKLGLKNRTELAVWWTNVGMLQHEMENQEAVIG